MGNPLDLLPGHRALGAARPLLGVLVHELTTWGLDDPRLVGLGGIAVPLPVRQTLHHVSDFPSSDNLVGVTSIEDRSVVVPGQRGTFGFGGILLDVEFGVVSVDIGNDDLFLQIPDLESVVSGSAQPVVGGREAQSVDSVGVVQLVQSFVFVEFPQLNGSVSSSRSAQSSVRRNRNRVNVSSVSRQVGFDSAVGQVPDFDLLVPTSRNDGGVGGVGGESDAGDPIRVSVFFHGELAFSQGVPQFDGLVSRSRDNLSVISRESNTQDILGVSDESSSGVSGVQIPESERRIPRSRQSERTIVRDSEVRNVVSMTSHHSLGSSQIEFSFSFGGQIPNNDALISRTSQQNVGVFRVGSNSGDPSVVSF